MSPGRSPRRKAKADPVRATPGFVGMWRLRGTGAEVLRREALYRLRMGVLRRLVPLGAAVLVLAVALWPILVKTTPKFRLEFSDVLHDRNGRDEVINPRYVGVDSDNQPYQVTAEVAMRADDGTEQIFLMMPQADLNSDDGWMTLKAEQGTYDQTGQKLVLNGAVSIYSDSGFEVHTDAAHIDLAAGTAESDRAVHGQGPWGLLDAAGFHYRHDDRRFLFTGRPHMTLYPDADEG